MNTTNIVLLKKQKEDLIVNGIMKNLAPRKSFYNWFKYYCNDVLRAPGHSPFVLARGNQWL